MATKADEGGDPSESEYELLTPEHFLPASRIPEADRRMGIDGWTGEAGLIAFAASLDRRNPLHLVAAWAMLVILVLPTVILMGLLLRS